MKLPYNVGYAVIFPDENDYRVDIVRHVGDKYQVFLNALHEQPSRDTQSIMYLDDYCYDGQTQIYRVEASSIYTALAQALDIYDEERS